MASPPQAEQSRKKATLADFNPVFREYASSAAFRIELSAGMIEYLLWFELHPQTEEICNQGNRHPDSWTSHPNHQAFRFLHRRGLVFHEYVAHPKGVFVSGPGAEGKRGYYRTGLTRAGEIVAQLVREAGWGPIDARRREERR